MKELKKLNKTDHHLKEMSQIGGPSFKGKHFDFLKVFFILTFIDRYSILA